MLVLSRKVSEQIIIGEDIILTVVSIRGSVVRIGVDAPPAVSVHRGQTCTSKKQISSAKLPLTADPTHEGGKRR